MQFFKRCTAGVLSMNTCTLQTTRITEIVQHCLNNVIAGCKQHNWWFTYKFWLCSSELSSSDKMYYWADDTNLTVNWWRKQLVTRRHSAWEPADETCRLGANHSVIMHSWSRPVIDQPTIPRGLLRTRASHSIVMCFISVHTQSGTEHVGWRCFWQPMNTECLACVVYRCSVAGAAAANAAAATARTAASRL